MSDFNSFLAWIYDNPASTLYIGVVTFLFAYGFLIWFYVFLLRMPYLYLSGKRTASKCVIEGVEQQYYDYYGRSYKPYWMDTLFKAPSLSVDKSADEFTWGNYVQCWFGWLFAIGIILSLFNKR